MQTKHPPKAMFQQVYNIIPDGGTPQSHVIHSTQKEDVKILCEEWALGSRAPVYLSTEHTHIACGI